jgi:hypothetical protein
VAGICDKHDQEEECGSPCTADGARHGSRSQLEAI